MHANFHSEEGTVNGTKQITFSKWKPKKVVITNDSVIANLEFKFNDSESYGTLKPTETISMYISVRDIYLRGSSIDYRVWGIG